MMKSLRSRLIAVMMGSVIVFWVGWGMFAGAVFNTLVDTVLKGTAELVLSVLPAQVETLETLHTLTGQAPGQNPSKDANNNLELSIQLWLDGRLLARTHNAPQHPLRSSFQDGLSHERVEGRLWYVYSLADPVRKLHVQVGRIPKEPDEMRSLGLELGAFNMVPMLALFGLLIWGVTVWSLAPVRTLSQTLQAKAALDFSPLHSDGLPAELQPLLQAFNRLLERLDHAVNSERRFLADAAHELRTPMAALLTQAHVAEVEAARLSSSSPALMLALQQIAAGVRRGARLAEQLLDHAGLEVLRNKLGIAPGSGATDPRPPAKVQLRTLCTLLAQDMQSQAEAREQELVVLCDELSVHGDLDALAILLRNLLDNAMRYSPKHSLIALSCERQWHGPSQTERICLSVADNGPGVPEALRDRIFDRFYRVPGQTQRGSGIGLSLVADIAQAHGASVEASTGLGGRGLAVRVWFEAVPGSARPDPG